MSKNKISKYCCPSCGRLTLRIITDDDYACQHCKWVGRISVQEIHSTIKQAINVGEEMQKLREFFTDEKIVHREG